MSGTLDSNKYGAIGEYIKENTKQNSEISIASPIFTIYAFQELMNVLKDCDTFKFLFNEPTFLDPEVDEREYKEFAIQVKERENSVSEYQYELGLKNRLNQIFLILQRVLSQSLHTSPPDQIISIRINHKLISSLRQTVSLRVKICRIAIT